MRVRAAVAIHAVSDGANQPDKFLRYRNRLSAQRVERRNDLAGLDLIFATKIEFKTPVNSAKQNLSFELWAAPVVRCTKPVRGDQQFIRPVFSQHIDPDELRSNDHRMQPVDRDCLNRMKALEFLPIPIRKCHVAAKISCRSSRLQATQDVMLGQCLVFDADGGVGINAPLS